MKTTLRKLKQISGVSLVEMLATVVLIGIMGIALTVGIQTVRNTYGKIVRKTNEQLFLSTTLMEMKNELRCAVQYKTFNGEYIFLSDKGYWFWFVKSDEGIKISYSLTESGSNPQTLDLVPLSDSLVDGMINTYSSLSISEDGKKIIITGLKAGDTELKVHSGETEISRYVVYPIRLKPYAGGNS